ncbi:polysaccharide deacetylase family protein [Actinocrinis puniceicyclus]|uniref:Polysaccharide deacetylase family protein n=1 Tax=Actinocrinis puniceicyclus TaxID=977794 RepID=A0A8J8B9M2_9ACTN|nr:polysaccharide deacetylase family protein [Actinocrinis puniceicyclus]MBS2961987.1 polysaccharide deacetylase family protein [Actinocrinis puniceicyclus]
METEAKTAAARTPVSRRRFMGGAAGLAVLGSFAAACQGGSGPAAGAAADSAEPIGTQATGASVSASASATAGGVDAELISRRYQGLKPFAAVPPAPTAKPIALSAEHPAVFSKVPTGDKVVFVTIDDGIEKDPAFIQMVRDFQIPITVSLADTLIRDDYAYFEKLYQTGFVSIQNHTVNHPLDMPRLSAQQQLDEIAGQQQKLGKEYGVAPYIFRAPGGNYNATTVGAVRQAGLKGLMMWKESMEIHDMQYQTASHLLRPGDIILAHFRGPAQLKGETMVQMMINLYKHIQAQGFTVADITKYV